MRKLLFGVAAAAALLCYASVSVRAETTECTEITALPATINAQGVYCLKMNLVTAITSGNAITINANNVTIDLNGWKLGGSVAGVGTLANGIFASNRKNIILRNGSIRGFYRAIALEDSGGKSSGHIVEDILADGNRFSGIWVDSDKATIRNNNITNTGPTNAQTQALAIYVQNGSSITIYGNTVSGVDETASVFGIVTQNVFDVDAQFNRVFDLKTAPIKHGIVAALSNRVVFKNNTVSSGFGGTTGIGDFSTSNNVACIDNQVTGFTANFSGCDTAVGNVSY